MHFAQGMLAGVLPQVRQVFERIQPRGDTAADARFQHFRDVLWPRMQSSGGNGASECLYPTKFPPRKVSDKLLFKQLEAVTQIAGTWESESA